MRAIVLFASVFALSGLVAFFARQSQDAVHTGLAANSLSIDHARPSIDPAQEEVISRERIASFFDQDPVLGAWRFTEFLKDAGDEELMRSLLGMSLSGPGTKALRRAYRGALARELVRRGMAAEILAMASSGGAAESRELVAVVINAVSSDSPKDALELLDTIDLQNRNSATSIVMRQAAEKDPAFGLEYLKSQPADSPAIASFFVAWSERDPLAAAAAAEKSSGEWAMSAVIGSWAQSDPDAAWAWLHSPAGEGARDGGDAYIMGIAQISAEKAIEEVFAKPELQGQFMIRELAHMLASDAATALALLDRAPMGGVRENLIAGAALGLAERPDEAMKWIEGLLPGERKQAIKSVMERMSFVDPELAIELADTRFTGPERLDALKAAVDRLGRYGFGEALAIVSERLSADTFEELLPDLMVSTAGSSSADALRSVKTIPPTLSPELREKVLTQIGQRSSGQNKQELLGVLESLPASDREAFASGIISELSDCTASDLRQLASYLGPERLFQQAPTITDRLADQDIASAVKFLQELPEESDTKAVATATRRLVAVWAYSSPDAASAYVGSLPSGPVRDAASEQLSRRYREFDLERATTVLPMVSDPETRLRLFRDLAISWGKVDPVRGNAVLGALARTNAEREKVRLGGIE